MFAIKEVLKMAKNKHLTLSDRYDIEKYLNLGFNFSQIARIMNKSDRTIAFEVKKHKQRIIKNSFNNTKYFPCEKLSKTPFVCNGCDTKHSCRKTRFEYYGKQANDEYKDELINSRKGIDMQSDEFNKLNAIVKEEVKEKGHSFAMVVRNHQNEFSKTKRTLYNYLENGYLDIDNLDLPRKVRYKQRKKNVQPIIRKTKIREGRTYVDFLRYKEEFFITNFEDANIVQMDTVCGPAEPDQSCILTLLFTNSRFLMIFKLQNKTMAEVNKVFDYLKQSLGLQLFSFLFQIILTDNGSEFFDPDHIENNGEYPKTRLFYCDPMQSQQKGKIEVAHEYIRKYIPKGGSFNRITQEDLNLICNHINSVPRDKLLGMNAFYLQKCFAPDEFFEKLGYFEINSTSIILKDYLIKKDTTN